VRAYSRGMRQKLALVQAFQHDPDLLVLDEPTEGLDPLMRERLYELLQQTAAQGKTVFLSSHVLPEVERVCERVAMVREGRLIVEETVASLRARMLRRMEVVFGAPVDLEALRVEGVVDVKADGPRVTLLIRGSPVPALKALLRHPVEDLVFERARLEEIFLEHYRPEPGR
jgi:ABC-2 type transport system ATP-binding protein